MPYKTGSWGKQAKDRSKKRCKYFREHFHSKYKPESFGYKMEEFAHKYLVGSRLVRKRWDIEWGKLKIDVKASMPNKCYAIYKGKKYFGTRWKFFVKNQRRIVDYYFLIGLNEGAEIKKMWLIPEKVVKVNTISCGINKSKYDKWLINEMG